MPNPYLSVIVPAYNGSEWLSQSLAELESFVLGQPHRTELVLVDDCSDAATAKILADFVATRGWVRVLRNDQNRGKGFAVARGMLAARGRYRIFTDADLAYPVCQIRRVLAALETGADIAVANRVHPESRYTMSPSFFNYLFSRHVMSRIFNRIVQMSVLPGVHDTQAGLKGFSAQAAKAVFPRVTIERFGFDIELLVAARAHGLRVVETPVLFRYDNEPSTVRFSSDVLMMLRDLVLILRNRRRGLYAPMMDVTTPSDRPAARALAPAS